MNLRLTVLSSAFLLLGSCVNDNFDVDTGNTGNMRINLSGEINQLMTTRANDSGFCNGDVIGIYIVDYDGTTPGTLKTSGNRADNVLHTYDESSNKWNPAYEIEWKDEHTAIDAYGYYPVGSPTDVKSYTFTVQADQSKIYNDGTLGGYEASDLLWGKVSGVQPTSSVITLSMSHIMACLRITLVEGDGFSSGEWSELSKVVLVSNTLTEADVDLATGIVSSNANGGTSTIIPYAINNEWRAIVVPQTVAAGTSFLSITVYGKSYKFFMDSEISFIAGKMNNFAIKVDKKENTGDYALSLFNESITPWEADEISHDATSRQYIAVDVPQAGTLEECVAAAGLSPESILNLKVSGNINAIDIFYLSENFTNIEALNLKEVKINAVTVDQSIFNSGWSGEYKCAADVIPQWSISLSTLKYLVFPDSLKGIEDYGLSCPKLTGSLTLPEGLEYIGAGSFSGCSYLTGTLTLPSALKVIGPNAFANTNFNCELQFPESLTDIQSYAFFNCSNLYGELRLPSNLKSLGINSFMYCSGLTGSLEIPQGVTEIPDDCFRNTSYGRAFSGNLILHDGIKRIGANAFFGCNFTGELVLPKGLTKIENQSFRECSFTGLYIPESVTSIGEYAFYYNTSLSGTLEFSENLTTIGNRAFYGCALEGLVFPASLESIGSDAFCICFNIESIVCRSESAPTVLSGAFDGVAKDNFAVEVPENSVTQYQNANGWSDFKRIVSHHELVCRPSVACALSTQHTETLVIDAEGEWEVESMPDWCQLSQTSGNNKTEITLTIQPGVDNGSSREGEIVFRLKDKDYTTTCRVSQYGYQYGEDEYLELQKASKGNNGGINIVIIGDGYDARDIASGTYLTDMKQQIEYFFAVEPYTTYRDYFNVYTAFPLSTESGVGTVNTILYNRFSTTFTSGSGLSCDTDEVFNYALGAPTVNSSNLDTTLIILVPNSTQYGGITQMWESGAAIAICPKSANDYPLDSRGIIQHEAGGHGFGKFADEYIYHNAFIDACGCICCEHEDAVKARKALGWYDNIELTGKTQSVGWKHLLYDSRYSSYVDIYEGGFFHSRGVFRSEQNSCMNNNIPYFSAICRESIVKRIKQYAGETYSFDEFVANDSNTPGAVTRSSGSLINSSHNNSSMAPVVHKGRPSLKNKNRK